MVENTGAARIERKEEVCSEFKMRKRYKQHEREFSKMGIWFDGETSYILLFTEERRALAPCAKY